MKTKQWLGAWGILVLGFTVSGFGFGGAEEPLPEVPAEYAGKHMPEGWWTDAAVIEEGRQIFNGEVNKDVNCSGCHGKDGKPVKRGARDFRATRIIAKFSDSFWFWRISEGVPNTKMPSWKGKLSEEQRWKVMTYEHTFSHDGKPSLHSDYKGGEGRRVERDNFKND